MKPARSLVSIDINWRTAGIIAKCYLALSAFDFALAVPILFGSTAAFEFLAFISGPAGFLAAFWTLPQRFTVAVLSCYLGGTCLLAPFVALSCHRHPLVGGAALFVAVLLWIVVGFVAFTQAVAFSA